MELNEMQNLWKSQKTDKKNNESIQQMALEKSQPVLKRIKKQLLLEMILWTFIVVVYHSAFDGNQRPAAVNLVFVIGFIQAIAYNLSGYLAARNLGTGNNLLHSIQEKIAELKKLQLTAVASRTVLMLSILFFFSYGLELNSKRLFSLAGITVVFALQLGLVFQIWKRRIVKLKEVATLLSYS